MDVSCSSTLPVAGFTWRTRAGQRYATIVCKATYTLAVGQSALATAQEPVSLPGAADDARGDRLPFKPRSEVLVSGSVHAPEGRPTRRVVARVVVGDVDKMIAVVGNRTRDAGGQESEPQPFTRMPLVWERTAGGPETWNPVGIGDHLRDSSGRTSLPNVVGIEGSEEVPAGFGPIAPDWAPRAQFSAGRVCRVDADDAVLEDGIDPAYFQLALPDQQQRSAFDADTRIVLENLHPEHPRLVTNLAPLYVVASLVSDRRDQRHPLLADTLWIDTDRSRAWLVFRAVVPLGDDEIIRAHVDTALRQEDLEAAAQAGRRPEMPSILDERSIDDARAASLVAAAWPAAPPSPRWSAPAVDGRHMTREIALVDGASVALERTDGAALPFRSTGDPPLAPAMAPPLAPPKRASQAPPAVAPPAPAIAPSGPVPLAVAAPARVAPTAPPSVRPEAPGAATSGGAVATPGADRYAVPSAVAAVRPELAGATPPPARVVAGSARAAESGVLAASNDAAGSVSATAGSRPGGRPREPRITDAEAREPDRSREPLELLWFDTTLALRDVPHLATVLGTRTRRGVLDVPSETAEETRQRRDVLRVLSRGAVSAPGQFDAQHAASVDADGGVRTPIVVASGDMVVRFDEREALRAAVGVASPFAPLDKALKEACDLATTIADSEWSGSAQIESASQRLREALGRAGRDAGAQRLDATVQRKLLERRRFHRVTLLGATWLRFDLAAGGAGAPVPLYLSDALADLVPLFERLPVRVIAELRRRQDEAEAHADALFVKALARRLGPGPAPARS